MSSFATSYQGETVTKAEKGKVQRALVYQVKTGRIVRPDKCSKCEDKGIIHGHHPDYGKPLEVVWLCAKCHQRHHAWLRWMKLMERAEEERAVLQEDRWLSSTGVARMIGRSEGYIYQQVKAGAFVVPVRIGRRMKFKLSEIRDWMKQKEEARKG